MLLHVGNQGQQYQFTNPKKVPFISHYFNIKEKLKLDILVYNFGFFQTPLNFLFA